MKYFAALCTFLGMAMIESTGAAAQPDYYNSRARQNAEYKNLSNATNRAYSVPNRPAAPAPYRGSSSSGPASGSGPRSSSSSSSSYGNNAPAYTPAPEKPKKTNAEIIEEHNAWLRREREKDKEKSNQYADNYRHEKAQAEQRQSALADEQARAPKVKALATRFEAIGFTPTEAFAMAFRTVPPVNGAAPAGGAEIARLQDAQSALERFTERRATGTYAELAALAKRFELATITALNAQQSLAARFPGQGRETELAELMAMPYIWGGSNEVPTLLMYERATETEKREAVDRYRELAAKHPDEAARALTYYHADARKALEAALAKYK